MTLLARYLLAIALANDPGSATAERACGDSWAVDSDAWEECRCVLETYRCSVQGWCSDPQGQDPSPPPPPVPAQTLGTDPGCA